MYLAWMAFRFYWRPLHSNEEHIFIFCKKILIDKLLQSTIHLSQIGQVILLWYPCVLAPNQCRDRDNSLALLTATIIVFYLIEADRYLSISSWLLLLPDNLAIISAVGDGVTRPVGVEVVVEARFLWTSPCFLSSS